MRLPWASLVIVHGLRAMDLTVLHHSNVPNEHIRVAPGSECSFSYGPFGVRMWRDRPGFAITASGGAEFIHITPPTKDLPVCAVVLDPLNVPYIDVGKEALAKAKAANAAASNGTGPATKAGKGAKKKKRDADEKPADEPVPKKRKVKSDGLPAIADDDIFALFEKQNAAPAAAATVAATDNDDDEAARKKAEKNRKRREREAAKREEQRKQIETDAKVAEALARTLADEEPKDKDEAAERKRQEKNRRAKERRKRARELASGLRVVEVMSLEKSE